MQISVNQEFQKALAFYREGKIKEAEKLSIYVIEQMPNFQIAWKVLGAIYLKSNRKSESLIAFQRSIQLNPKDPEGYNNLGATLEALGRLPDAEVSYQQAIALKPDYAEAYFNLAVTLQKMRKLEKAETNYRKTISLNSEFARAYNNLGVLLTELNKLEESKSSIEKAISIDPNFSDAYYNMGVTLNLLGKLEESEAYYTKAIELNPNHFKAYNNFGNILQQKGNIGEAIEAYKKTLLINPDYFEAYDNLGTCLKAQGKLEESIKSFKKALSINPNYPFAYNNMGNTLQDQGKLDKAIEAFNKALSLKPDYAEAYYNLGNILQDQGKLDNAIEAYNKALSLKPDDADTHLNLSFALLNSGKLQEGFNEYEWRWKTKKFLGQERNFLQPLWDGKKCLIGKRILIWCEQGVGDTLMWSSCLSLVNSQAEHCILECQEKLVPLLERSFPNVEVKAVNKNLDKKRNDFDFHLPMGSLYKHFIHEIRENAKPDAYLIPDPLRVNFWRKRLNSIGKGPYIGISWKSANMDKKRLPNYATISELYPVLKLPNATYVNLQYVDFKNDLIKIKKELGVTVHNFDDLDHFNNIDDVAALCVALDMVVSTKTTVPLISAGVGSLTKLANWRKSSWNNILLNPNGPLVHIFERDTGEPWENVFSSIAEDIFTITKSWSS